MPRKKQTTEPIIKSKGLFDHINQIRNIKNPNYYDTLTEAEKKSFNHYMICRFLSMDPNVIDQVCYLSKIFDKMDSKPFYKVCCEVITPVKFTPYIKSKNKKFNKSILDLISDKYQISKTEAKVSGYGALKYALSDLKTAFEKLKNANDFSGSAITSWSSRSAARRWSTTISCPIRIRYRIHNQSIFEVNTLQKH